MRKFKPSFTLIELLVVITIINFLSSVILVSANSARFKARMLQRVTNLREIQKALELYNLRNDAYPSTNMQRWSECSDFNPLPRDPDQWIPGLVPDYIRHLPADPFMKKNSPVGSCYAYVSDGKDYKLILYQILEYGQALDQKEYLKYPQLIDPRRDGGTNNCLVDYNPGNPSIYAWAIYTAGTTQGNCNSW